MNNAYRNIAIIAASILLQACSSIHYFGSYVNLTPNTVLEEVTELQINSVDIFYKKLPNYEYEEVAIVEGIAAGNGAGLEHVFYALKQQAAFVQGDGIFKIEIERYTGAAANIHATGVIIKRK